MAAARKISPVKSQKNRHSIRAALVSAVLEWLLIGMLFIEAILSYFITKFACYYELQIPCLLCSRLDHILGNRKLKYYWDLICGKHKLEISSLVLCHAHNNLVDVHGMCESCLFSFATVNKSNAETYRLLVGKLREDSSSCLNEDPLLENHMSSIQSCSCCNGPWIPREYSPKLVQTKLVGSEAADFDVPLTGAIDYDQNNQRKIERSLSVRATHQRINSGLDNLAHIGYTELSVDSDTGSEVHFSDDDGVNAQNFDINPKEDIAAGFVMIEPHIMTLPDDLPKEKLIDGVTASQTPISVSHIQSDFIESHVVTSISPTGSLRHGLEELQWQQADIKSDLSALPKLVSLNYVPSSSIAKETPVEASKVVNDVPQSLDAKETLVTASKEIALGSIDDVPSSSDGRETPVEASEMSRLIAVDDTFPSSESKETFAQVSTDSKLVSLVDVLPLSHAAETPIQGLKEKCIARTEEIWQAAVTDSDEICKTITRSATMTETALASETNPVSGDNGQQVPNLLDLGDAYKLAVSSRGRQLSGVLAEQWIGKDSSRLSDDLKLLLSQFSAAREQSMTDASPRVPMSPRVSISPKVSVNSEELKNPDVSSSIGMQILQKRISLERNESGLSLDGSIVSEIEGESLVDRLNRQIEHDKKLLSTLYKELEEERNASAIAANQAMAMITRLQEEKATLQMEALQYLRMMEEQAEYDMEALQKTNDLLAEREKEIQDLEADLEFFRNRFSNESFLEYTMEQISRMKTKDIKEEPSEASCVEVSTSTHRNCVIEQPGICYGGEGKNLSCEDKNIGTVKNSLLDFEDERSYILHCLKKLEKKLLLFSNNQQDLANGEHSEREESVDDLKGLNSKLGSQLNSAEEDDLSTENDKGNRNVNKETFSGGQSFPSPAGGINLDSLANEVSDLNERLKALEADRNFLEHSFNSIRNGEEGLRFIKEIASQLTELRRIGIRGKEQSIA